eukprot:6887907-Pyramimonas_sp.AAC.1
MPVALVVCDAASRPPMARRRALRAPPRPRTIIAAAPPSLWRAASSAAISDSVEEWATAVCFLHTDLMGKNASGPARATKTPKVDFDVLTQSADEAPGNSAIEIWFGTSRTHPHRQ